VRRDFLRERAREGRDHRGRADVGAGDRIEQRGRIAHGARHREFDRETA
jgi:hypothetical protein